MLWIMTLALVVPDVAKPTHRPLGVRVKEAGRMRIGVDGTLLHIRGDGKCTNFFTIWYPVTEVTVSQRIQREGFCPCYPSPNGYLYCEPSCPLKLDAEDLMDIDVDEAPKGCVVTLTNAFLASKENTKEDEGTSLIVYVAVLVSIGVLVLLVLGVVAWFCWRPKWRRARAARNAAHAQKNVGAEMEEEFAAGPPLAPVHSAICSVLASSGITPVKSAPPPPVPSTAPSSAPTPPPPFPCRFSLN